jgi:hypothetical protein
MSAEHDRVLTLDAELKNLLAAKPLDGGAVRPPLPPARAQRRSRRAAQVREKRAQLRDACEVLLFSDLALAVARDVEALCWRSSCYRFIEDFRRRIKRFSAASGTRDGPGQAAAKNLVKARGGRFQTTRRS